MMRIKAVASLMVVLACSACWAGQVERLNYIGEMKLTSASGKPMGSQAILFEKIHDPDNGTIIERAVSISADGKVEDHPMDIKVEGDAFTLSDREGKVKGTGTLFGPAWHWTYFKAEYHIEGGMRVEDENFMTDPSVVVARKKVYGPDGKLIMYMEGSFKAVTPEVFQILSKALLAKAKDR